MPCHRGRHGIGTILGGGRAALGSFYHHTHARQAFPTFVGYFSGNGQVEGNIYRNRKRRDFTGGSPCQSTEQQSDHDL